MALSDIKIAQFYIKVDGTDLPVGTMEYLYDVCVEDDLGQPAMFVLRFHDPERTLVDATTFGLGKEVVVSADDVAGRRTPIMTGEITALEPSFDLHQTLFTVRGYDKSHRLYRGSKTRTFLQQTDSQIASAVIQQAGLSANVLATTEQHAYVIQANQTDMDFLRDRAARNGYRIVVDGASLKFRPYNETPPEAPVQKWGETLLSLDARLTAVAQSNSVEVRGWNPTTKQAVVGSATTPTATSSIGDGKTGGQAAQTAFNAQAKVVVTDHPIRLAAEATKIAQAVLDEMAGDYLSAEGVCYGEPALKAGTLVRLEGVGTKFGGSYFVTATTHKYSAENGYTTAFTVNGRRPSNVLAALDGAHTAGASGVVVGLVTNINDPDSKGRVKVKFPWLSESDESDWARLVAPGAGATRGMMFVPEVNDEVLVAFEHGDWNRPYVVGGLWNGTDAPPLSTFANQGKVELRTIKTRNGHYIQFKDTVGATKGVIEIKTAGGHIVTLSDDDKKIEVKSSAHTITLDDQGRAVTIHSGGDLEISNATSKLKFTSTGIELSGSGGKLAIAPAGIELAANANATVKANANLQLQANAMLDVKSSAIVNVQGTLVKIN